jgi:hypothetical protein
MGDRMKQFTALALFDNLDQALEVERVLRAEGYSTQILDDVDDYSRTVGWTFGARVTHPGCEDPRFGQAWKAVEAIIESLGGFNDEAGLVNEGELPRKLAYPDPPRNELGYPDTFEPPRYQMH